MRYILLLSVLLVGCGNSVLVKTDLSINKSSEAPEWILKCAKAANPMSDEEGEDLVYGCARVAKELFGKPMYYVYDLGYQCITESYEETKSCYILLDS